MIDTWLAALEQRHLADLTFSEVARALRALSATYVERRDRLARKPAFDSAGKRAAYALYYSPLHFLTVSELLRAMGFHQQPVRHLVDLGCGAGAAGAAWAMLAPSMPEVTAIDSHPWATSEAAFTYRVFGVGANVRRADAARAHLPRHADAVIAGWMLNELSDASRTLVQAELRRAHERGARVVIVEPIATRVSPWWRDWVNAFAASGARADEWRFRVTLPPLLKRFDRATGLRHDELTARSLYLP